MIFSSILARGAGWSRRKAAAGLARRAFVLRNPGPLVSFTFDDFPVSALSNGGRILEDFGARGTYYFSYGLMGREEPTGKMFSAEDLAAVIDRGHELGCHTYDHCHASRTQPAWFES
jgi:peptidoglycan/xylan/chitin deacetylase (PgdA/CDA1 family)